MMNQNLQVITIPENKYNHPISNNEHASADSSETALSFDDFDGEDDDWIEEDEGWFEIVTYLKEYKDIFQKTFL